MMTKRKPPRTELERFEALTMPEPNSGCWLFLGSSNGYGYGRFCFNKTIRMAHRVSYEIYVGPIPEGMNVCHRCDTPPCVNPDHLFLGTQADNLGDMKDKGRGRGSGIRGERHPRSKLTADIVRAIRAERAELGTSFPALARKHGVGHQAIMSAVKGETWGHVK